MKLITNLVVAFSWPFPRSARNSIRIFGVGNQNDVTTSTTPGTVLNGGWYRCGHDREVPPMASLRMQEC
jgi:hypothetical protein